MAEIGEEGEQEARVCAECPQPAIVGMNGRWLCLDHYTEGLDTVAKNVTTAARLWQGLPGQPSHGEVARRELEEQGMVAPLEFAPSEEMVLHCDVPGCEASVSMVSGVPRSEHDWGRLSVYGDGSFGPDTTSTDYDLCAEHYRAVKDVLGR